MKKKAQHFCEEAQASARSQMDAKLNVKVVSLSLGTSFAVVYVLCVIWGTVVASQMPQLLEAVFPGFVWLTPTAFVLGLIESFLYGLGFGALYVYLHNALGRLTG